MRIVTNALELAPATGIDVHAFQVSRALAQRGHIVDVVAQRDGIWRSDFDRFARSTSVYGDFLRNPIAPKQLLRFWELIDWSRSLGRAVRGSRKLNPEVLYVNSPLALMWACAASYRRETGIVCHLHSELGGPLGKQRSIMSDLVDEFLAPSAFVRDDWIANGLDPSRIRVTYQAVDPKQYPQGTSSHRLNIRRDLEIPESAPVVLFVGRVVEGKGVHVLIEAWRSLGFKPGEGCLLVIGPAYPPSYLEHLRVIAPAETCRFLPMQPNVLPFLQAADLTVVPSIWNEACPRVVIEAMAAGCPVIASATGGTPEILNGQFAKNLFKSGDSAQLADRIRTLITWRTEHPELADACTEHIIEHFSLVDEVDEIERSLTTAAARH
jgi:glycosyltransferase involved in cell wall biosynthesis